jgi:hypothetical protein
MAPLYKAEYPPNVPIDEGIVQFFETFYETSDTPDEHEKYASSFTKDATLVMASKISKGRDGMSTFSLLCSSGRPRLHDMWITMSNTATKHRYEGAHAIRLTDSRNINL